VDISAQQRPRSGDLFSLEKIIYNKLTQTQNYRKCQKYLGYNKI
jgi:hypothetical protein